MATVDAQCMIAHLLASDRSAALPDVLRTAERPAPDAVYHDLDAGEVSAVWNDTKQVVILEAVGGTEPVPCPLD